LKGPFQSFHLTPKRQNHNILNFWNLKVGYSI